MVGLEGHAFGNALGSHSIGHSGIMGSPFGFHDPGSRVSAAVIVNGLQPDQSDLDYLRRYSYGGSSRRWSSRDETVRSLDVQSTESCGQLHENSFV